MIGFSCFCPVRRSLPTWLKLSSEDVKEQIYKLAKKGLTPSQIGVILRDSHGVAQVRRMHTPYSTFSGENMEDQILKKYLS